MATVPPDLKYLPTHEWHRIDGDTVTIGITQLAADELTDVTFVSLPKVGTALSANARFGEIESVKATSDLYTGVAGTVTEVNEALNGDPSLVNSGAEGDGWFYRLRIQDPGQLDALLDEAGYRAYLAEIA